MRILVLIVALAGCAGRGCTEGPDARTPEATVCAAGEVADGDTCVPEACGVGPWGNADDGAGPFLYVDASSTADPDGTAAAPWTRIQDALDAASEGDTVVVAAGTYEEALALTRRTPVAALLGRCAALVTVDATGQPDTYALHVDTALDPPLRIGGLTVTGGDAGGVYVEAGVVTLAELDVTGNHGIGLVAGAAADVTGEWLAIRGTLPERSGAYGYGVDAEQGAVVRLYDTTIADNANRGVYAARTGTYVLLERVLVTGTYDAGAMGAGARVEDQAELELVDSVVEGFDDLGLSVDGPGTRAVLTRTTITGGATAPGDGQGAQVELGGRLEATDSWFDDNGSFGVGVFDAGSTLVLQGGGVRGTVGGADASGIALSLGSYAELTDVEISGGEGYGLLLDDGGSRAVVDGLVVADVAAAGRAGDGVGVSVEEGAALEATDLVVRGCAHAGVQALAAGTATLTGGTIEGTAGERDGFAVAASGHGSAVTATDVHVIDNFVAGLHATEGGAITWTRGSVARTAPRAGVGGRGIQAVGGRVTLVETDIQGNADGAVFAEGLGGDVVVERLTIAETGDRAVEVQAGATFTATGLTVTGAVGGGILGFDDGTRLTLTDVAVGAVEADGDALWAMGVVAQDGAALVADGLSVADVEGPGLYVLRGSAASCTGCAVSGCAGAAVLVLAGTLTLDDATVSGGSTARAALASLGAGGIYGTSTLTVTGGTFTGGSLATAWLEGPGLLSLTGAALDASGASPGDTLHGNAVFARDVDAPDGASGLALSDLVLTGGGGPTVLLHAASARLDGIDYGAGATRLRQQACDGVVSPPEELPTAGTEICPTYWGRIVEWDWRILAAESE